MLVKYNTKAVIRKKTVKQRGAGLFFALLAMMFLAGYVVVNLNIDRDRMERERVEQTAWLLSEITQAARLYVRDQNAAGTALFQKPALCAATQVITPANLAGYIGPNVGQLNGAGTNYVTALGQTVHIRAAISTIDPTLACAPNFLQNVAATAYVVLQPPAAGINMRILSLLAESLSNRAMPTIMPLFDAAGVNISPPCGGAGGAATLQWDTGCLTPAQYNVLMDGPDGDALADVAFAQNTMGLPAWLKFRGDARALLRFEHEENALAQNMATDLRMAPMPDVNTATCGQIQMRAADPANASGSVMLNSGVCAVTDDNAGTNNRLDIINLGGVDTNRLIITPQAADFGGAEADAPLAITGDTTITGNVRSFAQTPDSIVTNGALNMATNGASIAVIGAVAPNVNIANGVTTNRLQAATGNITGQTTVTTGSTTIANNATINNANLTSRGGAVLNRLSGTNAGDAAFLSNVTLSGEAVIGGNLTATNATTINNGADGSFTFATARLDVANTTTMSGDLTVGEEFTTTGQATLNDLDPVTTCVGDCPRRNPIPTPGPPL